MATKQISKVIINLTFDDKKQLSFTNVKFDATEAQIKTYANAIKQSISGALKETRKIVQEQLLP